MIMLIEVGDDSVLLAYRVLSSYFLNTLFSFTDLGYVFDAVSRAIIQAD